MSKLAIQYVSPQDVRPYTGNARTHSKRQIRQIADSIQRFGFANPVLVSGNHEVIAGHGRLAAAKLLGLASVTRRIVVCSSMGEGSMTDPHADLTTEFAKELAKQIPIKDALVAPARQTGQILEDMIGALTSHRPDRARVSNGGMVVGEGAPARWHLVGKE
jgi:hypothetical protein